MIKSKTNQPSPVRFNYEAGESDKKRRQPSTRLKSVDNLLTPTKRQKLTAGARDLTQNFSLAAWAVRRHLDYVSAFTFQPRTGDKGLDRDLDKFVEWFSSPFNCDVARRHSLPSIIRLCEQRRTVDGDVFLVKLSSGHLQVIEGDRVRNPDQVDDKQIVTHGVRVSKAGRMRAIAVHGRDDRRGYEFERWVPASRVYQLGYFDRFDQVRGVSPLAPAVNVFRDIAEASEYALAKMKVSQLFSLVFYRESTDNFGEYASGDGYDVKLGTNPIKLDLEAGDRAEFLESKSPPMEFQHYMDQALGMALKSLDIPVSFADESKTNYSSSRSAWIHYEKSTHSKRQQLRELLQRITGWRLGLLVADGDLSLPRGMTAADVRFEWVHSVTPWVDPQKEVLGDILAIAAGLKTRSQVVRERHGREFNDVVEQLAREEQQISSLGVSTSLNKIINFFGDNQNDE